jgi:hypothetical protein
MKKLVTISQAWRAIMLLFSLFVFSSASAQQPCDLTVNPSGEILFESVQGAAVYKVITVTNTSSNTLNVQMFQGGYDSAAFSFEPRSFMLQASGKKEFKVYFKPNTANMLRYSSSIIFSTAPGTICTSVELIGTGTFIGGDDKGLIADPGSFKFPSVDIGGTSCKEFTIKNTSTSAAVISAVTVTGSAAFLIDGLTQPLTLGAGETRTFAICYKPTTQEQLYATGKVKINYVLSNTGVAKELFIALSSGANSGGDAMVVITPSQYQFPSTAVGHTVCEEFRVVNKSNMKATISSFSFEGDPAFVATSLTPLPVEISSWDSLYIKVCYTPTTANDAKGSLTVNYSLDGGITIKHATAVFFAITEKPACLEFVGADDWKEPILVGGKAERTLIVNNKTSSPITITEIRLAGEDAKAFTITATPPITIPAMSKVVIPFTFAPFAGQNGYLKEKYIAAVVLALSSEDPSSDCAVHEGHIWGYALHGHDDHDSGSVAISLFPDEKQTIGLSNRGIKESYTLLFKNNLDKDVIVQSISLMDGTKFKITETNPSTTPFTLKADETFTVTIEFESADGLLYKDKLIIVSDFAATALEFDLQGINAEKALSLVRSTLPEGVSVAIMPNPMRSSATVDFEGVRSAVIDVTDVLGSTIMSTVATGDWKWNGRMSTGAIAPAGTYFVRIQGESTNGERFVTTQRIVMEK